jgi:hypothetical protein
MELLVQLGKSTTTVSDSIQLPLKLPEPLILELNEGEEFHIQTMAREMFECPNRRRGRSHSTVLAHTYAGVILEFALARQGAIMNPAEFDYTKPETHNWDVDWNGWRAEVKNSQDPGTLPTTMEKKWLTIPNYMANKLARNRRLYPNCVDIVIFGCYNKLSKNTFDVRWRAVVPFDTIRQNLRPCQEKFSNNWTTDHDGVRRIKYFYNTRGDDRTIYNNNV